MYQNKWPTLSIKMCAQYQVVILCYCTYAVDGSWGPWKLGPCSVTCGKGTLVRTRKCDNPAPANGGKGCVGNSTEVQPCEERCCSGTSC